MGRKEAPQPPREEPKVWKEDGGSTPFFLASLAHLDLKLSGAGIFSPCWFSKYLRGWDLEVICDSTKFSIDINNTKQEREILVTG